MNEDLRILISVGLKSTTVTDINKELEKLAKDTSLQKLNVKINIDESFTKSINSFIEVTKKLDQALQQQNQIVKENITTYAKLDGSIEKVREKHLANGTIITQTNKKIDEHNQKLKQETQAYDDQRKTIQQFEKELVGFNKLKTQTVKNGAGEIAGYRNTYVSPTGQQLTVNADAEGIVKKSTQTRDYLLQMGDIQKIEDARIKSELRVRDEERKVNEAQQKAIQKSADADREAHNKKLSQLREFQRKAEETYAKIGSQKLTIDNAQKLDGTIAQVRSLDVNDANLTSKMRNISNGFKDISASAKEGSTRLRAFVDSAGKLAAHVPVFMAVHTAIYGVFNAISEGFRGMIDIEAKMAGYIQTNETYFKSLTGEGLDQKKINDQTQQFILTAHELGAEIGEVTESARLWGRMYKDVGVVQELVRQSTMLSTVDLVSLEDATKSMESVLAQYGVQLKNVAAAQLYGNRILDSWSKVAHDTMAPARDLGAAFERTGKIASETGVSFDFLNGLVSSGMRNTALSGENLGNMWKTVLGTIRTGKAVAEIEKLGVATKEVVDGTEQWRKAEDILLDLSIAVTDKNYDLTKSYADISRGVYQYAKLAASLNAGDILRGTAASISSSGETLEYLKVQMDTIQRKSSQVKTSFLEIFNTAGNDGLRSSLKNILDIIDRLLIGITKMPPGLIEFGALFAGVAGAAALAKQPVLNLIKTIDYYRTARVASAAATAAETTANTTNIVSAEGQILATVQKTVATEAETAAIGMQTAATATATTVANGFTASAAAATATMAILTGGLIVLAGIFVTVALNAGKAEKQHRDNVQTIKDEIAANNQLISQYKRQSEFVPKAAKAYKAYNDMINKGSLNAKQQADAQKQLIEVEKALTETLADQDLSRLKSQLNRTDVDYQKAIENEIDLLNQKTEAQRKSNKEEINRLQSEGEKSIASKYDEILKKEKELTKYKELNKYRGEGVEFRQLQEQLEKLKNEYASLKKEQQGYDEQLLQLNSDQIDQLSAKLGTVTENADDAAEAINTLFENIDGYADDVKTLNQTIDKLNKGQSLNSEEVYDLVKKYPELAGHVKKTTEGWKLELDAIKNLRKDKIKFANEDIEAQKKNSLNTLNESLKRIKIYGLELQTINNIQDAKKEINKLNDTTNPLLKDESYLGGLENIGANSKHGSPFSDWNRQLNDSRKQSASEAKSLLQGYVDSQEKIEKQMNDLLLSMSNDDFGIGEESKKNNKELNDSFSETNEILTATQKRLREIQTELEKLNNKRSKIKKGSEEYRKSLQEEIKLLKEQKNLYEDGINNPEKLVSTKVTTSSKSSTGSSSSSSTSVSNLIANAQSLQGKLTYKQISGEFKGTYDQFVNRALSDCSQFVQEMFKQFADVKLPRTAAEQFKKGTKVEKSDLQAGDLVFFNTTGKTASHVGIYTGNGKFIQMGNHGLSEQSLDSKTWTETYKYDGARRVSAGGVTTTPKSSSSSSPKTSTKNASQSDLDAAAETAKQKTEEANAKIYQLTIDIIQDVVTESENRIDRFSTLIAQSQGRQSRYSEDSANWRKEESSQSSYLQEQQKEIENQNKQLDKLVKENAITSGEFDKQKAANSEKWWDYEKQIQEKRFNVISSYLKEYDGKIDKVKTQFDEASAKMGLMTEGTKEYNDALQDQIPLLRNEQQLHQQKIDLINKQLSSDKLTAAQKAELITQLHTETAAWLDNESAIKSNIERLADLRKSAADKIISDYKAMIEKQRDLELSAFDQQKEAEDKRHEQIKKNLEEENKLYEDIINPQIKALDRQNSSDDHESELNNKLKDRQKLQDEINKYSLDESIEGKAKKKQLQEQLYAKDEEIAKFKLDRERELRKQSLQDQLDDHKNQSDQIADNEDKLNKEINDNIDQEKKAVEQKYKDILENDKKYYDLKQGLLSNDSSVVNSTLAELQLGYDTYFGQLKDHVFDTNQEFENLNYTLQQSLEMLKKYSGGDYSEQNDFPSGYTPPSSTPSSGSNNNNTAKEAWKNYLSNKQSAESITQQVINLNRTNPNSPEIAKLKSQLDTLKQQNDSMRTQYGFPDGSYNELKNKNIFSAETGGMTPAFTGGKFLLAHEKELVLNKNDTANLITAVDITRNMVSGLKNLTSLLLPKSPSPALAGGVEIKQIIINANDKESGESIYKKFAKEVSRNMKRN
ncbi:hypothetical protein GRF59_15245 [Paenibacillus sp. HJL G12]|uniref:NlpC/P60 domain-containing protein n=1 Tax=Paenibacillus dendrobii TaxID=2691084 RepID=A0A7X3LHB5_9BACL|nr:NlpC/P60 family protein [Paenibacillus dendrobii]MWV44977.1 hypothetical protein [Paenibacillus dendrobii]